MTIITFGLSCQAQTISSSVISTAGKVYNSTSNQLNWTLGEPVIRLMTTTDLQISSGYHNQLNLEALSIEDNEITTSLKIYPNPASDYLVISKLTLDEVSVNIYNELGQSLIKYSTSLKESRIDLRQLSTGVYIVNINNNDTKKSNSYKIIKK